ncbi:hypothetical protein B296_00036510 [Ensete ventricosum]|uniref:Uncharacterized protein n=1 Tax=Ensete ventricosum TaxID=4639 RepID=A0A426XKA0_ENSVE|nr:hypothetical protein B296_00036510 [Ensete ventricosum]
MKLRISIEETTTSTPQKFVTGREEKKEREETLVEHDLSDLEEEEYRGAWKAAVAAWRWNRDDRAGKGRRESEDKRGRKGKPTPWGVVRGFRACQRRRRRRRNACRRCYISGEGDEAMPARAQRDNLVISLRLVVGGAADTPHACVRKRHLIVKRAIELGFIYRRTLDFRFWCCLSVDQEGRRVSIMLSANVMVNRSSLEIFLDEIRQRDERPKDLPPALPLRPTSRGRLPRWRRPLPVHLNLERGAPRSLLSNSVEGEDEQTPNNERDVEQLAESPCLITPDLVRYEKRMQIDDGSGSPALSLPPPVGGVIKDAMNELSGMEDARNQTSQGIIWVQESFRGVRVCSHYQQLKKGATVLQSCTGIATEELLLGFMNFADARKSFVLKDMTNQPRQQIASQIDHYYEAEDKTPEVTVAKPVNASTVMPVRHNGSSRNAAIQLTIEFGQHRKVFHDDAGACIEAKSEQLEKRVDEVLEAEATRVKGPDGVPAEPLPLRAVSELEFFLVGAECKVIVVLRVPLRHLCSIPALIGQKYAKANPRLRWRRTDALPVPFGLEKKRDGRSQ